MRSIISRSRALSACGLFKVIFRRECIASKTTTGFIPIPGRYRLAPDAHDRWYVSVIRLTCFGGSEEELEADAEMDAEVERWFDTIATRRDAGIEMVRLTRLVDTDGNLMYVVKRAREKADWSTGW